MSKYTFRLFREKVISLNAQLTPGRERGAQVQPRGQSGQALTPEDLPAFFSGLEKKGREASTPEIYRHNMRCFNDSLPADKMVRRGTLDRWRGALLEGGYSPRTANVRISVANSLMAFLGRTAVTDSMKQLCRDARVEEEKVNPRCLRRLWQTTQDGIRAQLDRLVEQAWDSLLETEQMSIGWNSSKGVRGP